MKKIAIKFLQYIPDSPIFNWMVIILQSFVYHGNPFYPFTNRLNAYILRSKIKSHYLSNYVDKICAKDKLYILIGIDITPKTISLVENSSKIVLPSGDWIFKSSHNCSGGIIFQDGILSCAKRIYLKNPIVNPSEVDILRVLVNFVQTNYLKNLFWTTREACYKDLLPRYFFEELLVDSAGEFFSEYKFHCINGKVELSYIVVDRRGINKRAILDRHGNQLNANWCKPRDLKKFENNSEFVIPVNWHELIRIAELIASHFRYVRVDLYTDGNDIRVGELTFFHGSGVEPISPKSLDAYLGAKL